MLYLDITLMLSTTEIYLKLNTPRENFKKHLSCPQAEIHCFMINS